MAEDNNVTEEDYLGQARALVAKLEEGEEAEAARLLDDLTKQREQGLFTELGKLTRQLHEALNSFRLDSRVTELAEHDIPDARERLKYVIDMTEQSANRTLTAVESSMPVCEQLETRAGELKDRWDQFTRRELDAEGFRQLSRDVETFLGEVVDDTPKLKGSLQEVLMAQDFQDMTGQVIKRVIGLVEDVENSLVDLIRISGHSLMPEAMKEVEQKTKEHEKEKSGIEPCGPAVPGVDTDTVSGQDEVDDLLSSLGF